MRIGHFANLIWDPGGVASYVRRISDEQLRAGHEVFFFDRAQYRRAAPDPAHAVHFIDNESELAARARELRLDILHVHCPVSVGKLRAVPVVRTIHGHQPYCPSATKFRKASGLPCDRRYSVGGCLLAHLMDRCGSVRPAKALSGFSATWLERASLQSIPVIVVSDFLRREMARAGFDTRNIHVLHLPAPSAPAASPPPKADIPRLAFVGRITPQKGLPWLLRAISQTRRTAHWDIVGDGFELGRVKTLAAHLGIEPRLTFHGWKTQREVDEVIDQSRALILPSVWHEPGGTVAFEAMVRARAVIGSRVGGIAEVIEHGVNGLLVEPEDITALASAMDLLTTDYSLAAAIGARGRSRASDRFSMAAHMSGLYELYDQAISRTTQQSRAESALATRL